MPVGTGISAQQGMLSISETKRNHMGQGLGNTGGEAKRSHVGKPSSAYGWSGGFSPGSPVFAHL